MSGAVEGVALLPCPNPWCKSAVPPMPFINRESSVAVICGCDFHGPAMASRDEAITAWNTRTTPPARSYADGVEDAAKHLDERAERARVAAIGGGMDPLDAELLDYEYSNAAAAIRLLSQEPRT